MKSFKHFLEDKDPCWKGYKMIGMKKKNGKNVPNCVPEEIEELQEYGDTAKGQKMLIKVQKRAVDRLTSKKADTDPKYAKKNSDTANRAWDRMTDTDLGEGWSQKYKKSINCVPEEVEEDFLPTGEELYEDWDQELTEEAEKNGKKVKLNKPFLTPGGPKKRSVYVKNDKGNIVKVNFGDPNMEIKRDDPNRRSNYRARHHCADPGPKWKANYWSCKYWSSTPVSKLDK